jgi:hypothetical protein
MKRKKTALERAKQKYECIQKGYIDTRLFPDVSDLFEALENKEELTQWEKGRLYGIAEATVNRLADRKILMHFIEALCSIKRLLNKEINTGNYTQKDVEERNDSSIEAEFVASKALELLNDGLHEIDWYA